MESGLQTDQDDKPFTSSLTHPTSPSVVTLPSSLGVLTSCAHGAVTSSITSPGHMATVTTSTVTGPEVGSLVPFFDIANPRIMPLSPHTALGTPSDVEPSSPRELSTPVLATSSSTAPTAVTTSAGGHGLLFTPSVRVPAPSTATRLCVGISQADTVGFWKERYYAATDELYYWAFEKGYPLSRPKEPANEMQMRYRDPFSLHWPNEVDPVLPARDLARALLPHYYQMRWWDDPALY